MKLKSVKWRLGMQFLMWIIGPHFSPKGLDERESPSYPGLELESWERAQATHQSKAVLIGWWVGTALSGVTLEEKVLSRTELDFAICLGRG